MFDEVLDAPMQGYRASNSAYSNLRQAQRTNKQRISKRYSTNKPIRKQYSDLYRHPKIIQPKTDGWTWLKDPDLYYRMNRKQIDGVFKWGLGTATESLFGLLGKPAGNIAKAGVDNLFDLATDLDTKRSPKIGKALWNTGKTIGNEIYKKYRDKNSSPDVIGQFYQDKMEKRLNEESTSKWKWELPDGFEDMDSGEQWQYVANGLEEFPTETMGTYGRWKPFVRRKVFKKYGGEYIATPDSKEPDQHLYFTNENETPISFADRPRRNVETPVNLQRGLEYTSLSLQKGIGVGLDSDDDDFNTNIASSTTTSNRDLFSPTDYNAEDGNFSLGLNPKTASRFKDLVKSTLNLNQIGTTFSPARPRGRFEYKRNNTSDRILRSNANF